MSKWCLVRSTSGCEIIQECDILRGAAAIAEDIDYLDYMGDRVTGVILAMDRTKKKMIEEKRRMEGVMGDSGGESDTGSVSSAAGRTRSARAASISSNGSAAATTSAPRPTRVGQPPLSAPVRRGGTGAGRGSATARGRVVAASTAAPAAASGTPSALLLPPGQGMTPLIPPSLLPTGFSLTGSPPLVMPATTDDATFKQFMMASIISLHTEISGVKQMVNNLHLGWNPLIVQTANRATSTHQEVNGTKDRLVELEKTVKAVETAVQLVSAQMGKQSEFKYEPYSTKDDVDSIDKGQPSDTLCTDIQKLIYNESDPADDNDLSLPFKARTNKAKAKWLIEATIHRRLVSTGENRLEIQRSLVSRLNNYASARKRAQEKAARTQALRGASTGGATTGGATTGGQVDQQVIADPEMGDGMGGMDGQVRRIKREIRPDNQMNEDEEMLTDYSDTDALLPS